MESDREMAGFLSAVLSSRSLLALSLALNVSLILNCVHKSCDLHGHHSSDLMNEAAKNVGWGSALPGAWTTASSMGAASSSTTRLGTGADPDRVINLDHGDPTMYEEYWQQVGDRSTIVIPGFQSVSYFSDINNLCWFLEPKFSRQIIRLHNIVGNAVTKDRYVVVGTGSTQLYQAVLYALSPQDAEEPISVVSAAPYYSSYPAITDCLKSGLYKWAGDAQSFNKEGPYIELVTSPNNPDGYSRQSVINKSEGILVHDLAYYWPQYTPITSPADHEIMLFTVSKSTGHAGMRIGWALVKDREIAKKMTKFIELSTIGVSKDSQLRAAKVIEVVSDSCEHPKSVKESLFEFGYRQMSERWRLLRAAVQQSGLFSLPEFTPGLCRFSGRSFEPLPAFAWLKCDGPIEDCEGFLRRNKILTRSGKHFGVGPEYVRISILDRDENINLFIERLSKISLGEPM